MKLWIFDLDGTLTDSFPAFTRSMVEIFASYGKTFTEQDFHVSLASSMKDYFTERLGAEQMPHAVEMLRRLSVEKAHEVKPIPGIKDCLRALQDRGRDIAIWTARDRDSASEVLKISGLGRYASNLVSGNCVIRGKPHPEGAELLLARTGRKPEETVIVGDHHHDLTAARAAGIFGVRASWYENAFQDRCDLCDRQFYSVPDFAEWIRTGTK